MTHVVRQQFLHVDVNGPEADGLAVHRHLPDWCEHWLRPAVEEALDRCSPELGHLAIDRLEIDAGAFSLEQWETELPQAVSRALEQQLRATLVLASRHADASTNTRRPSSGDTLEETLAHFLRTGRLPWSWSSRPGASLEEQVLQSWSEGQAGGLVPADTRRRFVPLLSAASVRHRLWAQFPAQFRATFLRRLSPAAWEVLSPVLDRLPAPAQRVTGRDDFERSLWDCAFSKLAVNELPSAPELVERAWRAGTDPGANRDQLRAVLLGSWEVPRQRAERRPASEEPVAARSRSAQSDAPESARKDASEEDGIFIGNAGLVLLHPFLPQLFGALEIAQDDRLLQPARALGLLHFLASGHPIAPEHELVLPKVLCEWPLETPVPPPVPVSEVEINEATALLEAVVSHWSALGGTSPDGLRGSFLLRPGKLSQQDNGDWLLRVESRGFDILLEQLPWGISLIRLPWMSRLLTVEWLAGR